MNAISNWQRENFFNDLVKTGEDALFSDTTAPRTVILVRDDILPPLHQGIQSMHAVITLAATLHGLGKYIDPRTYLILLGATEDQIISFSDKLWEKAKKQHGMYRDPGLVDPADGHVPVTACAFEPMTQAEVRSLFAGLRRAK